jgi:hypothetical protein
LFWIQYAKSREGIRKTEKEKKKRNGKIEKGQGQRIGPVPETAHGLLTKNPEQVSPLSLTPR